MTSKQIKIYIKRSKEAKAMFCKHLSSDTKHSKIVRVTGYIPDTITESLDPENLELLINETNFGDRRSKREPFHFWSKRTQRALKDSYRCSLTGGYCIAREEYMHASDIPEGDGWNVKVNLAYQQRCPAYNLSKKLSDLLSQDKQRK